jgi:hypothetical protein
MDQLPNHKVPRIGSEGERYRDLQLIRQLPKQDLTYEHCRMIHSDIEKKEYNIFRELRDSIAIFFHIIFLKISIKQFFFNNPRNR